MRKSHLTTFLLIAFWPVTALVLYCDSQSIAAIFPYGQWLSNCITFLYLSALISQMKPRRQLLAIIFVPLSAIGEAIFTLVFGLYHYRLNAIPLYVPLGHAVLLSVGLACTDYSLIRLHKRHLQRALMLFHGLLIAGAFWLFRDMLSVVFGTVFFVMLLYICRRSTYLIIGVLVLYIELLGTRWGCWTWAPTAFGVLHTANPPVGAFACYVIADIIAVKCAAVISTGRYKWRIARLRVSTCEADA